MNVDDPKLTAFALGELDEVEEAKTVEALQSSPEARREVNETRKMAAMLRHALADEVEAQGPPSTVLQTATIHHSLSTIHGDRWFWTVARPLSIAATLAVAALIAAIVFGGRHWKMAAPRSHATEVELVDGSSGSRATSDVLPNPLQTELVSTVDHVVVGEMPDENAVGTSTMRVLEVIRDPARLAKLKSRLTTSQLRNVSPEEKSPGNYQLIFLDRAEHTIACASFSCGKANEALLRLSPARNDSPLPGNWQSQADYSHYAIPFPDWGEAIGYCPGAG
jgi:hypothetical protein